MIIYVYHNEVYGVAKIVALLYSATWLVVFRSQVTRIRRDGLHVSSLLYVAPK